MVKYKAQLRILHMSNDNILTKISAFFISRGKFTVLITLSLILFGTYSYTSLLKREGFPTINIPIVIVSTPYFSQNPELTEENITKPISNIIKAQEGVKDITTTSTANFSNIFITLEDSVTDPIEFKKELETEIENSIQDTQTSISIPNAGLIDGENDLIFSLYSNTLTIKELQQKAGEIEKELMTSSLIKNASVQYQIEDTLNVSTGKVENVRNSFIRVGINEGEFKGYDAINIGVQKKSDEIGALELSKEVREKVDNVLMQDSFKDISAVYQGDPAISLEKQINSLENNALAAIVTIFIILLLFINLRAAILLAIFIPLTLASVFITFTMLGYTLNTISLFALILVLGLFVDDGIIVVEAIDYYKRKGHKGIEAVKYAIKDIGVADISGTLTTVLVFIPLVTVQGVLGDFIKILPLTVIISLLVSLVIALTILPYLSNILLRDTDSSKKNFISIILNYIPSLLIKLSEYSGIIVTRSLSKVIYRIGIFLLTIFLIGVGGYYASQLSFSFFAASKDSDLITVSMRYNNVKTIEEAREVSIEVEKNLAEEYGDEILEIVYFEGSIRGSDLRVILSDISDRDIKAPEIVERINDGAFTNDRASVTASVISAGPPSSQYPFAMQIYSDDKVVLENVTEEVKSWIINLKLDSEIIVEDVRISYIDDIRAKNGQRYAELSAKLSDNNNSAALIELQEKIEGEYSNSDKYSLEFDFGQETENANSFSSVTIAAVVSILAMYILLVLQFNSFSQPLLILLAIPFSFPGLFAGLYYTNNPMSFFVVIGITGLIGIVVNNTIMLIEYANTQRAQGKGIVESISEAVKLRTRPIFATSLTTVAGLFPLAISEPFWEPLAFTIIFGLLSSIVMLVLSFPLFYYLFESIREWIYSRFSNTTSQK